MNNHLRETVREFSVIFWIYVLFVLVGCSRIDPTQAELKEYLPVIDEWKIVESPAFYTRDNLFSYINGSAELYFSYGFQSVVNALYEKENDPGETVTVDIYDMGTPLGAFGVYSSMTYPDLSYDTTGCEAIVSSLQTRFWQDRFEVEINSALAEEDAGETLHVFAMGVSRNLPKCTPVEELDWLPEENRVPHTMRYVAEGFLGHEFLPGGMDAKYLIDGNEVRGFVTFCEDETRAGGYLSRYSEAQVRLGAREVVQENDHTEFTHPHAGHAWVGVKGPFLFGAMSGSGAHNVRRVASFIASRL